MDFLYLEYSRLPKSVPTFLNFPTLLLHNGAPKRNSCDDSTQKLPPGIETNKN